MSDNSDLRPRSNDAGGRLPSVGNGRDSKGRFVARNRIGKGNPFGKRVNQIRKALFDSVSEDDLKAIVQALVERARAGEIPAIVEILNRLVGRPATYADLNVEERLDVLERRIEEMVQR